MSKQTELRSLQIQEMLEKRLIGEVNDSETRWRVMNLVEEILMGLVNVTDIWAYKIVCDETINTPEVIDENAIRLDLYIQEEQVSTFCKTSFYIGRTSASFEEVIKL